MGDVTDLDESGIMELPNNAQAYQRAVCTFGPWLLYLERHNLRDPNEITARLLGMSGQGPHVLGHGMAEMTRKMNQALLGFGPSDQYREQANYELRMLLMEE